MGFITGTLKLGVVGVVGLTAVGIMIPDTPEQIQARLDKRIAGCNERVTKTVELYGDESFKPGCDDKGYHTEAYTKLLRDHKERLDAEAKEEAFERDRIFEERRAEMNRIAKEKFNKGMISLKEQYNDPGYVESKWDGQSTFFISIKSPPLKANLYASVVCYEAKKQYDIDGFTVRILGLFDGHGKTYGVSRCA